VNEDNLFSCAKQLIRAVNVLVLALFIVCAKENCKLAIGENKLRHRIITMPAPRMTFADSLGTQPKTFENAMLFKCLNSIVAACWRETTFGAK
jgi:hypothetical protein